LKKVIILILAGIMLISLAGCSSFTAQPVPVSAAELKSDKPRTTPTVPAADMDSLVNGNSTFALNLYQSLKDTDGNLFYSPYSISEALAMTYGGASGSTATQMASALQFLLSQSQLHPAFNNLDQILATRGQGAQGTDGKGFRLNVVNAIWGQKDFSFKSEYLDLLAQNYGAGLRVLDFIKSPEPSRETINQWVSDQTEGKIQNLLPSGSINDATRLVLTNAIYFNAAWAYQFHKESTVTGTFNLLNGTGVSAQMMKQSKSLNYASGSGYQAVELPYDGNQLAMDIILPDASQYKTFEAALNYQQVNNIIRNLKYSEVDLSMPKFNFQSQFGLKQTLSNMGMPEAFSGQADFSGMDGKKDLSISDVIHKAFVSVDENGTEAAAATGVIVGLTAVPAETVTLTLDHPFIFLIRDIQTGAILFVGRVMNPAS
jgi:serpin B